MTGPGAVRSRILIAAGDPAARAGLERELASLGFDSVGTDDGVGLVERTIAEAPHLCLVVEPADGAPAVPALDACRRLRRDPRTAELPIMLVGAAATGDRLSAAVDAGADDVVARDQDRAVLGARVRALLRLKSATDALAESGRRMRELEKVRDDLMKMIVHDLKTPLTSVLATLEMLDDGDLGAITTEQSRAVGDMRARGDELLRLIDDLLQVWRIESVAVPLEPAPIVPAAFVDELLGEWEFRFRQAEATVHSAVAPDTPAFFGDRALLNRVFGNLFQNVLTHVPPPVELRIAARSDRHGVLFTVADSGPGIPPEYHEVIFRKFHRMPRPNDSRVRGSGLGLAFCRLAVEAHGGRVWVQSAVGHGSAFHVLLPLDPATAVMRRAWNI